MLLRLSFYFLLLCLTALLACLSFFLQQMLTSLYQENEAYHAKCHFTNLHSFRPPSLLLLCAWDDRLPVQFFSNALFVLSESNPSNEYFATHFHLITAPGRSQMSIPSSVDNNIEQSPRSPWWGKGAKWVKLLRHYPQTPLMRSRLRECMR